MLENLEIDGQIVPHTIFNIVKDGACLFRSISFFVYGHQNRMQNVRQLIVNHIFANWPRFKVLTHDGSGNNYRNKNVYRREMMKPGTFGSHCELVAAGEIFEFIFEIYRDGRLLMRYGNENYPKKRLRFTGNLDSGQFDVYLERNRSNLLAHTKIAEVITVRDEVMQENAIHEEQCLMDTPDSPSEIIFNDIFGDIQKFSRDQLPTKSDVLRQLFFEFNESTNALKTLHMFTENIVYEIEALWKKTTIPIISQCGIRIKVSSNYLSK